MYKFIPVSHCSLKISQASYQTSAQIETRVGRETLKMYLDTVANYLLKNVSHLFPEYSKLFF